jgi:hypothetical protein
MPTKVKIDTRDTILSYLKENDWKLAWLCRKIKMAYPTGYSIFIQKTISLSQVNLDKINKALKTEFTL